MMKIVISDDAKKVGLNSIIVKFLLLLLHVFGLAGGFLVDLVPIFAKQEGPHNLELVDVSLRSNDCQ